MASRNRQQVVARVVTALLGLMLAGLAGRLIYIEVASAQALAQRAVAQHYMRLPIRPMRGNILDARLRILAGSVECHSVFADPQEIPDPSVAAEKVARILGMDREELYRRLTAERRGRFLWLARRVPPHVADAIRSLRIHGVELVPEGRRQYPCGTLAAHVIGFVGREEQGLEGLERLFDERLSGREGIAYVLKDRRRRPMWSEPDQFVPAEDGQHLVLTIDGMVQLAAEEAIAEACHQFRARSATAIVMDPHTGAILAMANVPTFDPNRYAEFPADARRNRAVTDTHPPGSSGKPFIMAVALEAGVTHLGDVIYCENGYWAAHRIRDAGHHYGNLTFEMGGILSSNILLAKLGVRLGNERLHRGLHAWRFGHPTGVVLPGENAGKVFPLKQWTKYSTTRVAFGQEFAVTPLQLATAFAAIANGGKVLRPKVLRGVLDSRGRVVLDLSEPEVVGQAIKPATARTMIDRVLTGVVEIGTGKNCRIPGYRVFGKTGTAQGVDPETGAVSHTRYIASFLAGAPAEDPRVVVCVMVNEPDKALGYYGGTVAAPAARKILEQTLAYLGVPPTGEGGPRPPTFLVNRGGRGETDAANGGW